MSLEFFVKKKIVRLPYNEPFLEAYWEQAAVCPKCCSSRKTKALANHTLPGWSPKVDYSRTVVYECSECGCSWKVKPPKRKFSHEEI